MDSRVQVVSLAVFAQFSCRCTVQIVGAQVEKAEKRQWVNTSALARRHRRSRLLGPVESRRGQWL